MPGRTESGTRHQGILPGGMPYLRVGRGVPLVFLPGISANHLPPTRAGRRFEAAQIMPFAERRSVWWINRRPGLAPDATMADIAQDYADALHRRFPWPVDVLGVSTGGSVALQLAADHPDVVRRLVIVSAAYRLGPLGAEGQRRAADALRAGHPGRAGAEIFTLLGGAPGARRALRGVGRMLGRAMYGADTSDMIATIHAEDRFDLRDRLHEISAPTLVIGGESDGFYGPELFRDTAALIPNARLILREKAGHLDAMRYPGYADDVLRFLDEAAPAVPTEPAGDRH